MLSQVQDVYDRSDNLLSLKKHDRLDSSLHLIYFDSLFVYCNVRCAGANFLCFQLSTNKVAARKVINGCHTLLSEQVNSEMKVHPSLHQDSKKVTGFSSRLQIAVPMVSSA